MARPKFVAGNWKMNTTRAAARDLAAAVAAGAPSGSGVEVAVCPPFPWLVVVADAIAGSAVKLGAQDVSSEKFGAFTGEVSAEMLLDAGCKYVIVGHNERRHIRGEKDDYINRKAKAALAAGLHVIFCAGEKLDERHAMKTTQVLDRQLTDGLVGLESAWLPRLGIAYEPVWAIGTGQTATPQQAQEAHAFIRLRLGELFGGDRAGQTVIQYGGSVTDKNAAELMAQPDVDGALVGGASLKADSFLKIVAAAAGK
jgi:triosephosphate isomerase (TIM)